MNKHGLQITASPHLVPARSGRLIGSFPAGDTAAPVASKNEMISTKKAQLRRRSLEFRAREFRTRAHSVAPAGDGKHRCDLLGEDTFPSHTGVPAGIV